MRSIKSKHTKLERDFYDALVSNGIEEVEWNPADVFGKPDFAHKQAKVAIFLDSCFWHGCPKHLRMPHSNLEYWQKKIERNRKRDVLVTSKLSSNGWTVIRIWEHSLTNNADFKKWVEKASNLIAKRKILYEQTRA
jgi:DNA mismatch endonuclease (patch repair protein)